MNGDPETTRSDSESRDRVEGRHALEDEVEVWNLTVKPLRLPNNQVIRAHSSTNVRGWEIWKYHDVVKAWLQTGALSETQPSEVIEPTRIQSAAQFAIQPSVITGRYEPPASYNLKGSSAQQKPTDEPETAPQR